MAVAVPIGIMSAIYLGMYANPKTRDILKPVLEILAGVPTVVYGYFAVTTVAPFFKNFFNSFGVEMSAESALSAGFVMGVMIIPFVLSLKLIKLLYSLLKINLNNKLFIKLIF